MSILITLFLLFGFATTSMDLDVDIPTRSPWPLVTINGNEGVILPRDDADELVLWENDGFWLPSKELLTEAEDAMDGVSIERNNERIYPELDGYRYYAGYMQDGERLIAIKSSCVHHDNWRRQVLMVMDGGSCFWDAVYNVDTGEIESLWINGNA